MPSESVYSHETIEAICEEVDRQWQYHLFARAAFPYGIAGKTTWDTDTDHYDFYRQRGARLKVSLPVPLPPGVEDIGHWLNQNYIVRLFGILYQHKVIKAGKIADSPFTLILAGLRQRVGTHTFGEWNPENNDDFQLTGLIRKHLDPSIDDAAVRRFNLSVETVLLPLKERCVEFVRTLAGQQRPN